MKFSSFVNSNSVQSSKNLELYTCLLSKEVETLSRPTTPMVQAKKYMSFGKVNKEEAGCIIEESREGKNEFRTLDNETTLRRSSFNFINVNDTVLKRPRMSTTPVFTNLRKSLKNMCRKTRLLDNLDEKPSI